MTEDETLLRDLLAGLAMAGDWAAQKFSMATYYVPSDATRDQLRERARLYYRMADAMLDVREES